MKYKTWLLDWLENFIKPSRKIRTYDRYFQAIHKHLIKNLGDYDLNELTPSIIQQYINFLLNSGNLKSNKGLSSNSVNCIISVIKNSLKIAYNLGLVNTYIGDKIIRPKRIEKQIMCFSKKEQNEIENYIIKSNNIKLYGIILCLYLGIRIGELLALESKDINFEKQIITICKSCHDSKNGRILDSPKTASSYRIIPIPKQIVFILKKLIINTSCSFLITEKNKPISIRSYQRTFELLLKKLNIEYKSFHSLRHTFATRALECGVDVKTLAEILGHKNANVTLCRYVHSMFEHKQLMMNKIGKNLNEKYID